MRTLGVLAALLWSAACESSTGPALQVSDLDFSRLNYFAYGADEDLLLVGTLYIDVVDDTTITGSWSIRWDAGADTTTVVGPQVGDGDLVGYVAGGVVIIELNPSYVDNNVSLILERRTEMSVTGRWSYATIAGPWTWGRVVLEPPWR